MYHSGKNSRCPIAILVLILTAGLQPGIRAQCVSAGPVSPGTSTSNSSIGSVAWTSQANALSSDNNHCSSGVSLGILSSANSHYLIATGAGFSAPSNATICGIEVTVERCASGSGVGSNVRDNSIRIVKNGSVTGNNMASGSSWPGSDATVSYGGSSNDWGTTWTPDEINASNFGVAISAEFNSGLIAVGLSANIDHVSITVHYRTPVILPIQLDSFRAFSETRKVKLEWQTLSEENNNYFEVEKLGENDKWTSIAKVPGAGTSAAAHFYESYDLKPEAANYYRIRQVDFDKNYFLSDVVFVNYEAESDHALDVFPMPFGDCLTIGSNYDRPLKIELYSTAGELLRSAIPTPGSRFFTLGCGDLKPGFMILKVYYPNDEVIERKLVKN